MKKEIKKLPKSKIEIEFEIPVEEWEVFLNEAAKELSNSLRVQGFRPGNMPRKIVEREIGFNKVLERGIEIAVRKTYIETIINGKIEAIGHPKITVSKAAAGNPFVFKAEVFVMPEVEIADYKKIASGKKLKKEDEITVEENELNDSLDWLRKSRAKYITVNRPAKDGDRIEIDFSVQGGFASGGEDDNSRIKIEEQKNHALILGQSKFIKGFDENLKDLKEGEEKEFSLTFPNDYHEKDLAGKLADFKVKVNLVQKQEIPELTDEFAKSLGGFDSLDKLKESVKQGVRREKIEKEKNNWQETVVNEIAGKSKMDIPDLLVNEEVSRMLSEMKANVESFGLPWEKYLEQLDEANPDKTSDKTSGKTSEEELREKIRPQAEKKVKQALVIKEIGKREAIDVLPEEIKEETDKFLRHYGNNNSVNERFDTEDLKEYTYGVLRNKKVFQLLESFSEKIEN